MNKYTFSGEATLPLSFLPSPPLSFLPQLGSTLKERFCFIPLRVDFIIKDFLPRGTNRKSHKLFPFIEHGVPIHCKVSRI